MATAPPRLLDLCTVTSCRWDTGVDGHCRITAEHRDFKGITEWSPKGVLLDLCAHCAYFWVLFITQIQNACFFPQNWVLHGYCGCRTAIQLLVDHWLSPF